MHSIEGGSTNAYLIIQFPNELFTVMNELRDQAGLFSRHPYIRYDRTSCEADGLLVLLKKFAPSTRRRRLRECACTRCCCSFLSAWARRCIEEQQADPAGETGPEQKQVKRMGRNLPVHFAELHQAADAGGCGRADGREQILLCQPVQTLHQHDVRGLF